MYQALPNDPDSILEHFLMLAEHLVENWHSNSELTPEMLTEAIKALRKQMQPLDCCTEEQLSRYMDCGIQLLGECATLAREMKMDDLATAIEQLCYCWSLWAAKNAQPQLFLEPIVNATAQMANSLRDSSQLEKLYYDLGIILEMIPDEVHDLNSSSELFRLWQLLIVNHAIIATRSYNLDLINQAYNKIVEQFNSEDSSHFFSNAREQMEIIDYPQSVREQVEHWYQKHSNKPTIH